MADEGISGLTAAVKETNQKVESTDQKLAAISKVLSLESKQEKEERQAAKKREDDAKDRHENLLKEQQEGNATAEEVEKSSKELARATEDASEAAEKRSMFDRLSSSDKPSGGVAVPGGGGGDDPKKGGIFGSKKFKGFLKLVTGFMGILAAMIIPALAYFMNDPKIFAAMKDGIFSMINFFSESGPLASGLKPILEFFGVEGELDTVMKGIILLAAGLTAAVVFAPFKVMGGIKNFGAFLGKKMFGLVSTLGKALKPKGVPMPGGKPAAVAGGAAKGGAARGGAARGGAARGGAARGGAARGGAGRGGGITKAAKGLATMGQAAGKSIGSFIGGILKGIAGGLAAFANPAALAGLAAITLALVVLEDSFVPIGKLVESVGKAIKTTFEGIGVVVKDIGESVGTVIGAMGDAIGAVVDKISKLSTAGTEATTKQIKELSAIPADGMIAAAKGIDAMKKALDGFGGGTMSKIGSTLFGSGGPIDKIVELTKKVPELMKAAEAINVLGAAGSDFAAADAELSRRKRITTLSKDIASGDVEGTDNAENLAKAKAELAELRSQSKASGLSGSGRPTAAGAIAQSKEISAAASAKDKPGDVTVNNLKQGDVNQTGGAQLLEAPKPLNGGGSAALLAQAATGQR